MNSGLSKRLGTPFNRTDEQKASQTFLPDRDVEMLTSPKDFGRAVAAARRGLGLTQRELALAIGAGERFIVELEGGKPTAQLGKAMEAARAVGLHLNLARASASASQG